MRRCANREKTATHGSAKDAKSAKESTKPSPQGYVECSETRQSPKGWAPTGERNSILQEQPCCPLLPVRAFVGGGLPANNVAEASCARRAPTQSGVVPCRAHPVGDRDAVGRPTPLFAPFASFADPVCFTLFTGSQDGFRYAMGTTAWIHVAGCARAASTRPSGCVSLLGRAPVHCHRPIREARPSSTHENQSRTRAWV